ncbi:MAG: phytanoyl-CoA dioxygenase family protein [Fuerstiella sp.]|nr:phytanoyl-CoA dioxygenase family protein [Fuerstiella sp.]
MVDSISEVLQRRWIEDGYLKVDSFLSEQEVADAREWVEEISSWPINDDKWIHHQEQTAKGDVRLSRTENFVPFHTGMKHLLTEGKLLTALGQLMGEPAVLYKEKINYKYPGGGGYAAHQDAPAYEFIKHHVTCLVTIDPMREDNGCLFFSPGRHQEGFIALDDRGCIHPETAASLEWVSVPTEPGDVLLFSSYAPHKSPPNGTNEPRRAIYLTYNALAEGDFRQQYYEDKRRAFAMYKSSGSDKAQQISKIGHFQGKTVTQ